MQSLGMGGTLRFYTFNLLNHDDNVPNVRGNRVKFAYQAIFSPFIPIWWVGEEWMNPGSKLYPGVMYYAEIEWDKLDQPRNRAFYEDVKKYIRIRRENPEIFEYFPEQLINTNIEKVESEMIGWGANTLQRMRATKRTRLWLSCRITRMRTAPSKSRRIMKRSVWVMPPDTGLPICMPIR